MLPVFVNHSSQRLSRRDIATMTARHLAGVVGKLGAERAHVLLGEAIGWPLSSFERIAALDTLQPLIIHLEQTRFANITTL